MTELILASTSVYRRELLARLGLPFRVVAPSFDEETLKGGTLSPDDLALRLAQEKAASVAARYPDACVIGSDQVVTLDGTLLGKPRTRERAIEQLEALSGRVHRLLTALVLLGPRGQSAAQLDVHHMQMRALGRDELTRYVDADQPLDCAGSYKIESRGIALFSRVEGSDFTAITGLPLIALTSMLRTRGFAVP